MLNISHSLLEWGDPSPCGCQNLHDLVMSVLVEGRAEVCPHSEEGGGGVGGGGGRKHDDYLQTLGLKGPIHALLLGNTDALAPCFP